jgi:hypothetical protein
MPAQGPHFKQRSWTGLPTSIELIGAVPSWAKLVLILLGLGCLFYSIAHYGLGRTLLRAIFSP